MTSPTDIITQLQDSLAKIGAEIAHLKAIGMAEGLYGVANLVSSFSPPELSLPSKGKVKEAQLVVNITRGAETAAPIAVVPFGWQGAGAPAFDLAGVVGADLRSSGRFAPLAVADMVSRPTQAAQVRFQDWRVLDADYLVIGTLTEDSPDRFTAVFQLFDVTRGEQLSYLWGLASRVLRVWAGALWHGGIRATYARARYRYRPSHYPGKLTLLLSEDLARVGRSLGWEEVVGGGIEVHRLRGNHVTNVYVSTQIEVESFQAMRSL